MYDVWTKVSDLHNSMLTSNYMVISFYECPVKNFTYSISRSCIKLIKHIKFLAEEFLQKI